MNLNDLPPLKAGFFDSPEDLYHSDCRALSRSDLLIVEQWGTAYLKHKWDSNTSKKRTPAMAFGSAFHKAVLEPLKFADQYCQEPERPNGYANSAEELKQRCKDAGLAISGAKADLIDRILEVDPYFQTWDQRREQLIGKKEVISLEDWGLISGMQIALQTNPVFEAIREGSVFEQSMYWQDVDTGMWLKGRIDMMNPELGHIIVDPKTAADPRPHRFRYEADDKGYDMQAAMYVDGVEAITGEVPPFIFAVVHKEAPHAVYMYEVDSSYIEQGRDKYKSALQQIKQSQLTNHWPTTPRNIKSLEGLISLAPTTRRKKIG
ncbi:hypothetical protein HA050_11895 [Iodobacter sp. HSC-16F04]|uniref:SAP domain-containing protein n=1 Tax=Iodobacter violaceini TaxID=3044271 RepID=A0ABX0L0E2_9NEIS|nr:PD-(D/E)XK nuclease-like domain-containing protein [Iodobacter violacea]NHQ86821.1 hypothetical protein [Iodobacter violacea]